MRDRQPRTPRRKQGKHPYHQLTAVSVRTIRRPGRHIDGHGLYLFVDPRTGAKRWIWRGVIQGKRCDLGLGGWPRVSLADAREEALRILRDARQHKNPRLERQQEQAVPTFRVAALTVHAEHAPTFKNAKHRAQWIATLETYAFPVIGDRKVHAIASSDVLAVLSPIWTVKPETARRVKQRIKLVFNWAKASGFCRGDNPTDGLTEVLPKLNGDKQHHPALPYQAVPAFLTALRTTPDILPAVRLGLEFLILTATRTNEVQLATWDEVDLASKTWTIPGVRMKSGRAHEVPLCARAVEVLEEAQRLRRTDSPWIFPGHKPGKPLSNMTFLKAARRLTTATLTTHGFRSSFRDWSAERTNIPRDVCEAALAHTLKDKTEAAYKRTALFDKRRELMDLWAHFATSTPATVHALRG